MDISVLNNYKLGIPLLDDKHCKIFTDLNLIRAKVLKHEPCEQLVDIFVKELLDEIDTEEMYMDSIAYPYVFYHKAEHVKLIEYISERKLKQDDSVFLKIDKLNSIESLILLHIDNHDITLSSYVKTVKKYK